MATASRSWPATTGGSSSPSTVSPASARRIILLNSEFSGPQIKEVSEREGAKLIIYDDEYTAAVGQADPPLGKLRALGANPDKDEPSGSTDETLADLIARSSDEPAPKVSEAFVDHHPDQRHHRNAQGRQPQHAACRWRRSAGCSRTCRSRPVR